MKQTLEIMILEDEPETLEAVSEEVERCLKKYPFYEYDVNLFRSGEELLSYTKNVDKVDLLIADIDLGSGKDTGITLGGTIRERYPNCGIIYLTNYLSYATDIYETKPLYFIVKSEYKYRIPRALEEFFNDRDKATLEVTVNHMHFILSLQEIIYMEHTGRKTIIHTVERDISVNESIPELIEKLPSNRFALCHRSYIVSLPRVASYQKSFLHMTTGEMVPMSRAKYDEFRDAMVAYLAE